MSPRVPRPLLLPVLALALAGCLSGGHDHGGEDGHGDGGHGGHDGAGAGNLPMTGAEDEVINVTAGDVEEYRFSPAQMDVMEGQRIGIRFSNMGTQEHEFAIQDLDFHLHALPGGNDTAAFLAPSAGTYTIGCYVPGHFDLGMRATLQVLPA